MPDKSVHRTLSLYYAAINRLDVAAWDGIFAPAAVCRIPADAVPISSCAERRAFFNRRLAPLFVGVTITPVRVYFANARATVQWSARARNNSSGPMVFGGTEIFEFDPDGRIRLLLCCWEPAVLSAKTAGLGSRFRDKNGSASVFEGFRLFDFLSADSTTPPIARPDSNPEFAPINLTDERRMPVCTISSAPV